MNRLNTNGNTEVENHSPGFAERMKAEVDISWNVKRGGTREKPKDYKPASDEEYLALFDVLKPEEIKSVLEKARAWIERFKEDPPQMIEHEFAPGTLFCLSFIPVTDSGLTLQRDGDPNVKNWVGSGAVLRGLRVNSDTHATYGFGGAPGYIFDLLPDCITRDVEEGGCTFKIDYPERIGFPGNTTWFIQQYETALTNIEDMLAGRFMN